MLVCSGYVTEFFEPTHRHRQPFSEHDAQHPMIRLCARATFRSSKSTPIRCAITYRHFSGAPWRKEDPRIQDFGREIIDEFAVMREKYSTVQELSKVCKGMAHVLQRLLYAHSFVVHYPALTRPQKNTIVLAHGLLGFDELRLAGQFIPGIHYWRGITDALAHKGVEVIVAAVPPSGSIEARSARLAESIAHKAKGKQVNIIAYVKIYSSKPGHDTTDILQTQHGIMLLTYERGIDTDV